MGAASLDRSKSLAQVAPLPPTLSHCGEWEILPDFILPVISVAQQEPCANIAKPSVVQLTQIFALPR